MDIHMKIKLVAMDVDGTMTDGKIYIGPTGEAMKAFSVKDGQGIAMLRKAGITTAIITARKSDIVNYRAGELKMDDVCQGIANKRDALALLCEKYDICPEEVAYIGDDIPDIPAMEFAGISFCPQDAVKQILEICDYVMPYDGGNGAVRAAAEYILENNE